MLSWRATQKRHEKLAKLEATKRTSALALRDLQMQLKEQSSRLVRANNQPSYDLSPRTTNDETVPLPQPPSWQANTAAAMSEGELKNVTITK